LTDPTHSPPSYPIVGLSRLTPATGRRHRRAISSTASLRSRPSTVSFRPCHLARHIAPTFAVPTPSTSLSGSHRRHLTGSATACGRSTVTPLGERSRAGWATPVAMGRGRLIPFFIFFIWLNFRNSYKVPKFIKKCINIRKMQSKFV
jgi:hypothetical protein